MMVPPSRDRARGLGRELTVRWPEAQGPEIRGTGVGGDAGGGDIGGTAVKEPAQELGELVDVGEVARDPEGDPDRRRALPAAGGHPVAELLGGDRLGPAEPRAHLLGG